MTATDLPSTAEDLDSQLTGSVHEPGDPGYDELCRAGSRAVEQRPDLVVRATSRQDVQAAVRFAARAGMPVAVQATGHRAAALPSLAGALLLHVGALTGVQVDPDARRAWAGAATPAADLVAAAAGHGLLPVVGSGRRVSVAGFTLGGGVGVTGRRFGLGANQVTRIEVVTADGTLRQADPGNEHELFWALRGTGGGLGVVTAVEVALHPVTSAWAGATVWDAADAAALMRTWAAWAPGAPDGITTSCTLMHVPPLPTFPEPLRGRSVVAVQGCSLDGPTDADEVLDRLRTVAEPIADRWGDTPTQDLQDVHGDAETATPTLARGVPLRALPPAAVDALLHAARPGSGVAHVDVRQLGGALATGAPDGGAVDRVDAVFLAFAVAPSTDPATRPAVSGALEGLAAALRPWRAERSVATFCEAPGSPDELLPPEAVARLRAITARVDPDGRFLASHTQR